MSIYKFYLLCDSGDGHHGPFGGSFVASSKYSSGGHGGGGSDGGYGVHEGGGFAEHYSDVLGITFTLPSLN